MQSESEVGKNEMNRLENAIETEKRKYRQLYDDKFNGIISEEMFREMSAECEEKRRGLEKKLDDLKSKISVQEDNEKNADEFSKLIEQYIVVDTLDKELLNRLIEKITISEEKTDDNRRITIRIFYRFVGDCSF